MDEERAEFEKWASTAGYSLRLFVRSPPQGEKIRYYHDSTASAWEGWQAARALDRAKLVKLDAEVVRLIKVAAHYADLVGINIDEFNLVVTPMIRPNAALSDSSEAQP